MSDRDPSACALRVEGVTKHLGGTLVLDRVDAALDGPGVLGIVGVNGSGKSTLLRLIAGIYPLEKGEVRVFGRSLRKERSSVLAEVGYAPDGNDVPSHLTVSELLSLVASLRNTSPPTPELIALLDAEGILRMRLGALSLGQRRRASLLAANVGRPRLLLLDEPTNGLDVDGLSRLEALLRSHVAAGGSAAIASHDRTFLDTFGASIVMLPSRHAAQSPE